MSQRSFGCVAVDGGTIWPCPLRLVFVGELGFVIFVIIVSSFKASVGSIAGENEVGGKVEKQPTSYSAS